jgi:hypothetical protein
VTTQRDGVVEGVGGGDHRVHQRMADMTSLLRGQHAERTETYCRDVPDRTLGAPLQAVIPIAHGRTNSLSSAGARRPPPDRNFASMAIERRRATATIHPRSTP